MAHGFWRCAEPGCGTTDEPHTRCVDGTTEETICADHCTYCTSGQRHADQEQHALDHKTFTNPGDPEPGHGLPTTAQSAAAEARGPHHHRHMTDVDDVPQHIRDAQDLEHDHEDVEPPPPNLEPSEAATDAPRRPRARVNGAYIAPHDDEAEAALIGAMLNSRLAVTAAVDTGLAADGFYRPSHALIYEACRRVVATGADPNPISIRGDLDDRGLLDQAGGMPALMDLQAAAPGTGNAGYYAERIAQLARLRRADRIAEDIRHAVADHNHQKVRLLIDELTDPRLNQAVVDDLEIVHIGELLERVDARPPVTFLADPVWPADAYGIIGAEDKLGKTWAILDLAVTVASGGRWLDLFDCAPGPVLAFLGEGGDRKMARRLRAVADHHQVDTLAELPLHLCHRVPHLSRADHLAKIATRIDDIGPAVIILDPLYLAAHGAKSSDLFDMGAHLEILQHLAQRADAALVVVHHWNKTGTGTGRSRFSGAGSAAWGRVLCSMSADQKTTDGHKSIVHVKAEFVGDEIPDVTHTFTRTVWADDPHDLSSPMHYELGEADADPVETSTWHGPTDCMAAILTLFHELHLPPERSKRKTGDDLRAMGRSYRQKTVDDALEQLARDGQLLVREGSRRARLFRLPDDEGTLL